MQPEDPDQKVWRYMPMPTFVDLIGSHELHFARSDTLDDPFEGSTTLFDKYLSAIGYDILTGHDPNEVKERMEVDTEIKKRQREMIYVSCWCIDEYESIAMWNMYGSSPGSVAVRTTYNKLCSSLSGEVVMGVVEYKNYDHKFSSIPNADDPLSRFMHKRVEYRHESEVRCLLYPGENVKASGLRQAIDIESVIEAVVIQPRSEAWVKDSMELLIKRNGLKLPVVKSKIDLQPIF